MDKPDDPRLLGSVLLDTLEETVDIPSVDEGLHDRMVMVESEDSVPVVLVTLDTVVADETERLDETVPLGMLLTVPEEVDEYLNQGMDGIEVIMDEEVVRMSLEVPEHQVSS